MEPICYLNSEEYVRCGMQELIQCLVQETIFELRPFYYSLFNKTLIFASETKSILEFRDLERN